LPLLTGRSPLCQLWVVPICPPPMISYRATFTYVLNSATLESQLGGGFDRGPVDVRGLVAYTYLIPGWRVGISPSRVPRGVSQPSSLGSSYSYCPPCFLAAYLSFFLPFFLLLFAAHGLAADERLLFKGRELVVGGVASTQLGERVGRPMPLTWARFSFLKSR
jgi:hypothetical protein